MSFSRLYIVTRPAMSEITTNRIFPTIKPDGGLNRNTFIDMSNLFLSMKRNVALTLLISAISLPAICADYKVSGKVISKADGDICPGATYRIFLSSDTVTPAAFNVTDAEGYFNQTLPSEGDYIMKIEYIGMKDALRKFTLSKDSPSAGLGAIALSPDDETLDELVVVAKKKLVESDGATLTYNVEDDPESQTNSTIEMLRKVPMVTVDAEDNIKVNGNSNFKILINGKEDPMLSGDVSTILKSMPAATIKKIEVITEPGAKYDAEGTGGILNIVTVGKQSLEGFMTNYSARLSTNFYGLSFYGRTKIRNVTASANLNYNEGIDQGYVNSGTSILENLTDDNDRYQISESKSKHKFNYLGANLNLSWEPDTLNLFTVQGNIGKNDFSSTSLSSMRMESIENVKRWSLDRDTRNKFNNLWFGTNASFQHTFHKKGHHIIGSYIFGYGTRGNETEYLTYNMENFIEETPWERNDGDNFNRRHSLQIDYANPLSSKHLIEAGLKGTWSRDHSDTKPFYGTSADNMSISESERVKVEQFQDIMAAYASYSGTYGRWNAKAGLRYEYTKMGLDYKIGEHPDFTTYLNDLVPNLAASYRMGDAANLRLAYQMRISRPGIGQLNPYRNTMGINQVNYGNPDLKSEKSNNISLTYSNYGGRLGGSFGISYNRVDNSISDYQFFEDNILHTTYANIGHSQRTMANLNLQWAAVPMLNIGVYLSGSYVDLKADSPELKASNSDWTGNFNMNLDYTFPFRMRLSAYGGAGSGWVDLQSKGSGYSYYGLSLSRSFLPQDALTFSVQASNFLQPYRTHHYTQISETSRMTSESRYRQWSAGASVTFRFGSLRADVKRTAAELEMMEGGASSGGEGGKGGM